MRETRFIPWTKKAPAELRPGQVKQSGSTLKFGPSYSASRRAEHFFEALTEFLRPECIFWTGPAGLVYLRQIFVHRSQGPPSFAWSR